MLFLAAQGFSGNKDSVLFTYGNEYVAVDEFKLVYEKNNLNKENAYSQQSLEEYLDLYVKFKLKVADAIKNGYDTVPRIKEEINKYKGQLSKSYLNEKEITSNLLEEGYNRMLSEVHASHILVSLPKNATPEDTLAAYKKISNIRKVALKKDSDFGALAKQHSEDPSALKNRGDLGFFTAFQMVYAFENQAYNTVVGKISKPFRTRFGYHIMKVHSKRDNRGRIRVAHLFLKAPKTITETQANNVKERIDTLYAKIGKGAPFEKLVVQLSDDKASAKNNGELRWFGSGEMVKEFEDAAFELKVDGDISKPVRTDYGWHIIKRLEHKPLDTYENLEKSIKKKIAKDSRSNVAEEVLIKKIKKENKYKAYPSGLVSFKSKVDSGILVGRWNGKSLLVSDEKLFKMGKKTFTEKDLRSYIVKSRKIKKGKTIDDVVDYYYNAFERAICMNIAKAKLQYKYPEFKALMNEYNDGILLFEITDKKVWKKAVEDTSGLETYYTNKVAKYYPEAKDSSGMAKFYDVYMWKSRMNASIFYCKDDATSATVLAHLAAFTDSTEKVLLQSLNSVENNMLKVETGLFEQGDNRHVDESNWTIGSSKPFTLADGQVVIVYNKELNKAEPKALNEVKGQAISDYQLTLEKEWISSLKEQYPIVINKQLLNSLAQ